MHILQVSRKCTDKYQYIFFNSAVVPPLLPPGKRGEGGRTSQGALAQSGKVERTETVRHSGPNENAIRAQTKTVINMFFLIFRCSPEHLEVETPGSVSPGF